MTREVPDGLHALIPRPSLTLGALTNPCGPLRASGGVSGPFLISRHGNVPATLVSAVAIAAGKRPPALPLLMIKSTLSIK